MSKKIINSELAPDPIGPYNQAIQVGNLLFVSGQIAFDKEHGELIVEVIDKETHMVMKNLQFILRQADADFSNVVKTTIFLKDLSNYNAVNEVYGSYFDNQAPARECVEVSKLPKDVNVEISIIASV